MYDASSSRHSQPVLAREVLYGSQPLHEAQTREGAPEKTQDALQQVAHGTNRQGWDAAKVKMDSFISQNISKSQIQQGGNLSENRHLQVDAQHSLQQGLEGLEDGWEPRWSDTTAVGNGQSVQIRARHKAQGAYGMVRDPRRPGSELAPLVARLVLKVAQGPCRVLDRE